jgi:uncharacterized protein with NRDE domain
MCLIVFALHAHPRYRLILAANRDEYFSRPSAPAAWWDDTPYILGGRDLAAGGTWLGISRERRLAAVTNYRDGRPGAAYPLSRGALPADFLRGTMTPVEYGETVQRSGGGYGGFNLLFGDDNGLYHCSNRGTAPSTVTNGIHGISNGVMDSPWPKVVAAKERLTLLLDQDVIEPESLLQMLSDREPFPDDLLPDTGIGIDRERFLSPIFFAGGYYGTRSTTVILMDRERCVAFHERLYDNLQKETAHNIFRMG